MNGYFKPLRRKIGVVTLGLACVLMGVWMRSIVICDDLIAYSPETNAGQRWLTSYRSHMMIFSYRKRLKKPYLKYWSRHIDTENFGNRFPFSGFEGGWYWTGAGFGVGNAKQPRNSPTYGFDVFRAPYWSIVIPLTLLSAWLLLSRPRATKPVPPIAENA